MMALTIQPGEIGPSEIDRAPIDDYHVDRAIGQSTRPTTHHILAMVNGLLLIILAAVSFALFWIVATLLGFI
jgi:hypothetical protein